MIELKIFYRKMSPGFSLRIFTFYLLICFTSATKKTLRDNSTDPLYSRSITSVSSFEPSDRELVITERVVPQLLDHFETDNSKLKIWEQSYIQTDKFFDEVKGIFILYISGESAIENVLSGTKLNWVKKFFAYYLGLEHRFYGKSQPTGNWRKKSLKYLTVAQALADTAFFIEYIHNMVSGSEYRKWIVVGGSYAGALAAWMRCNYPELVHGAVASSACFPTKPFTSEFFEVVSEVMNNLSDQSDQFRNSVTNIKQAFEDLNKLMKTNCKKVSTMFHVDIDCKDKNQVSSFFFTLTKCFSFTIAKTDQIADVLLAMEQTNPGERVDGLAKVFDLVLPRNKPFKTKDYSKVLKDESAYYYRSGRPYHYQLCTELGGLTTTDSEKHPFGHHFDSKFVLKETCQDIFGKKYNEKKIMEGIEKINEKFGGLNSTFSQTIFTVGQWDLFRSEQMTKENEFGNVVIEIEEGSHCQDIHCETFNDSESLKNAREEVVNLIKKILKGEKISGKR